MKLFYKVPPPRSLAEATDAYDNERLIWETHSLPLGNGFIGANLYGYTECESIVMTENSFANPSEWHLAGNPNNYAGGLTCFAKLHVDFGHDEASVSDYERSLTLDDGIYRVSYEYGGVKYSREAFASYPSRSFVMRLRASKAAALSFTVRAEIPYIDDHCDIEGDGLIRTGDVYADNGELKLTSTLAYYGVT